MTIEKLWYKYFDVFPKKHSLITAVHVRELQETLDNIQISMDNWADWVFLVDHEWDTNRFIEIMMSARFKFPKYWLGVNMLAEDPFSMFVKIDWLNIDWVRADNPMIKEVTWYNMADEIEDIKSKTNFNGLYFGWVAFKHQKQPKDLQLACEVSQNYMDVVTTSWKWTWIEDDPLKSKLMRNYLGSFPLAMASWISSENIINYPQVNSFIVATAISKDFYNLDPKLVRNLSKIIELMNNKAQ